MKSPPPPASTPDWKASKYHGPTRPSVLAQVTPNLNLPPQLAAKTAGLLSASLAASSWRKYEAAWAAFDNFQRDVGKTFTWPLGRDACAGFTTWLTQVKGLKPSTAATYLSGLVKAHELRGLPKPTGLQDGLACIRGASHLATTANSPSRPPRRAVTLPLLKILGHKLAAASWPIIDKQAVWACSVLAFFTSARLGELLAAKDDTFDPTATLCWADIKFRKDGSAIARARLPKSGRTEYLDIFPFPGHGCCPMEALQLHRSLQQKAGLATTDGPVFRLMDGKNLTPQTLNRLLKSLLKDVVDYSKESISCHSFRAGVASTLARFPHLASTEDIRGWGRWDSSCYLKYTRLNLDKKKAIFKRITDALNSSCK